MWELIRSRARLTLVEVLVCTGDGDAACGASYEDIGAAGGGLYVRGFALWDCYFPKISQNRRVQVNDTPRVIPLSPRSPVSSLSWPNLSLTRNCYCPHY
ncbi:hypothetical protein B0H11DRAFT_2038343 [Mycena galericulata]|nr:hypothetical protein B0H11DRAFT_2038343 [Mycena galericulata]